MKGKAVIPLVLGLFIGLAAMKLVVDTLKKARASSGTQQTVTAVRAKQDIPAFTQLTKEMVETVETSDSRLAPSADRVSSWDEIKDRVTAKAIPQDAPILKSMLAPPGTPPGMQGRIQPGFRAVSVKIDEVTGVAYQVQPGDLVDVIVVMDIESGDRGKKKETIAEVILQRVEVAAIGQSTATSTEDAAAKVKPAKSATLLVQEADVPKLHLAATRGKITLSMRGNQDLLESEPAMAHSADLFKALRSTASALGEKLVSSASAAPKSWTPPRNSMGEPEPPHGVIVYRRSTAANSQTEIERITFENARSSKIIDVADNPVRRMSAMLRGGPLTPRKPSEEFTDPGDEVPPLEDGAGTRPTTNPEMQ
jgi:pilus assembly protein CpaB